MVAGVPAVNGVVAADRREDSRPTQTELPQRDLIGVLASDGVAGLEPVVVGAGRQQVADAEVTGLQPLATRSVPVPVLVSVDPATAVSELAALRTSIWALGVSNVPPPARTLNVCWLSASASAGKRTVPV